MPPPRYPSLAHRIIANSVLSQDSAYDGTWCWEWIGPRNTSGYGHIKLRWKRGPLVGATIGLDEVATALLTGSYPGPKLHIDPVAG